MSWGSSLLCCWPGLPGLWYRGRWTSLILAIGFSVLFNLALVSSFIWTDIFHDDSFTAIAWPVVLLVWLSSALIARQNLPDLMSLTTKDRSSVDQGTDDFHDTLFIDARREYLKGHWQEARGLLERQLKHQPRDIESRLMLATLYRHTRQFDAAISQLDHIEKYDPSVVWKNEIERERELLRLTEDFENSPHTENRTSTNNDGFVRVTRNRAVTGSEQLN